MVILRREEMKRIKEEKRKQQEKELKE